MTERTQGTRPGDEFQDGHRLRQYNESGSSGFISGQRTFCDACAHQMGKDPQQAAKHWVRSDDNCEHPDHDFNTAVSGVEEPSEYAEHKDHPEVVGWTKDNFGPGSDTTLCPSCAEDRRSRGHSMEPYYPLTSGKLMPQDSCDDCGHDLHQGRKTAMRKQSAYYGEKGQYPQPGTIVRRDHAEPGYSYGRGGQVYDYHADGDPACDHQQDSEWRSASDHCTGHYNPKHPLQAAIDKYNNYKGKKSFVPIMNNTWIHKDDQDRFHIRHHDTDILSVSPNGDTTIDVDGYHTATTGKRLHQFLPKNIQKMKNPSRAQGASDYSVAVNSDPDHHVYGMGEERGRFGMHPNTTLHDYDDGISFNAHTGERVQDHAASHSGTMVHPPMAKGSLDTTRPTIREPRGYYQTRPSSDGPWHGGPYPNGRHSPVVEPYDPTPMHEQQSTHEEISRQLREVDHDGWGPDTHGDNVGMGFSHHDLPSEGESFDDWMDRTTKPAENVSCPSCKGRGTVRSKGDVPAGVQPWEHREECPNCQGKGLVANSHRLSARTGALLSDWILRQRYDDGVRRMATLIIESYGETRAPNQVDTLRDDTCPVCGDSDSFDGDQCQVCGYVTPPKMFQDPDLEKAKLLDLRADPATGMPNDTNPNVGSNLPPVDPGAVDEEGEVVGEETPAVGGEAGSNNDDSGVVEGDVRTLDDQPANPEEVDEEGNVVQPEVDPEATQQPILQGGEPFTKGPNAPQPNEPMAPEDIDDDDIEETGGEEGEGEPVGEEDEAEQTGGEDDEQGGPGGDGQQAAVPEGQAEGAPGYPGDATPDLMCPACGFEAAAATPTSTPGNLTAPASEADGMLEGDVCPNCQKATLMGIGQVAQMAQGV